MSRSSRRFRDLAIAAAVMAAVVMPTTTADAQAYCEPALYPWYLSGTLDAFTSEVPR